MIFLLVFRGHFYVMYCGLSLVQSHKLLIAKAESSLGIRWVVKGLDTCFKAKNAFKVYSCFVCSSRIGETHESL